MKTAIVIPALNAVRRGVWEQLLQSVAMQDMPVSLRIVLDSSSEDGTCAVARSFGWQCLRIAREKFNHGRTRDRICRILHKKGIDYVVFLTQDVILSAPETLRKLLDFLQQNDIAGCYGRQRSSPQNALDQWQRACCYPENSFINTPQDLSEKGMKSVFFSNAFSAWKTAEVIRYGGFPETDFGEDSLLAYQVLLKGGRIGYCAGAVADHEHPAALSAAFARGVQVGQFHRNHPELPALGKGTGTPLRAGAMPPAAVLPLAVKLCGYGWGRWRSVVLPILLFCLIWLLILPAILLAEMPPEDVADRYAPMAEAFAGGDWQFAFHPRVTPLFTVCAGVIAMLTGCGGYLACKLAGGMFLSLSVFPLYGGCRRMFGEKIALTAGLLFATSAYLLRLGYYGLREPVTIAGVTMLFYAAAVWARNCRSRSGVCWFAAGAGMLVAGRGDMALFASVAFLILLGWDLLKRRLPVRTLAAGVLMLLMLSPCLYYNYRMIGYPVPEIRHAVIMKRIISHVPALDFLRNPAPALEIDIGIPGLEHGNE